MIWCFQLTDQELDKDEIKIIAGALDYKNKTVKEIMTNLEDVYMLPIDGVLDFDTIAEIREQGKSCLMNCF